MTTARGSAVITGSDSGIGRATALALAAEGYDIGVTWHRDQEGARLTADRVEALGRRACVMRLDLRDGDGAARVLSDLASDLGDLRVLVNNAAINHRARFVEQPLQSWRDVMDVNLTGPFVCAQTAARDMIRHRTPGRIINVTSVHEHVPLERGAAYAATKAGLAMLSKVMALELAPYKITVNCVAPGHVATPMNGYLDANPLPVPRTGVPAARIGLPKEIAAAVRYLASDEAGFTTGHSLVVDGGLELMAAVPLQQSVESSSASA